MPLEFNQATAERYKDQLQTYKDRIDAETISQDELDQGPHGKI